MERRDAIERKNKKAPKRGLKRGKTEFIQKLCIYNELPFLVNSGISFFSPTLCHYIPHA